MRFGSVPVEQAGGKILGHNIAAPDGRRAFRKGRRLTPEDVSVLKKLGRAVVYVADLDPDDVPEDAAAARLAGAAKGACVDFSGPSTGRVNLRAQVPGVFRLDAARLVRLNELEGITLATLPSHAAVLSNQVVATLKIIPFAVPEASVRAGEALLAEGGPLLWVEALERRRVGLILSAAPAVRDQLLRQFAPLLERVEALGSRVEQVDYVTVEEEAAESELVEAIDGQARAGMELILLAGQTAVMDRHDVAPRAVERAGGRVESVGAPVDPGNLLMLSYLGKVPILGAPGCARSRKVNIVDWVLPRLLVGERLRRADIVSLGHGGLLEDAPERPMPRSVID